VTRLFVVGIPRSGTTWIGEVLGATAGTRFVKEPDGDHEPFAYAVRRELGSYPVVTPGDRDERWERLWDGAFAGGVHAGNPRDRFVRWLYRTSPVDDRWKSWLEGDETPRLRAVRTLARPLAAAASANVLVKSVRASFCADWVVARYAPRVLHVKRHPMNILSSWSKLGYGTDARQLRGLDDLARDRWGVEPPPSDASLLRRQAFVIGVLLGGLADSAAHHDDWTTVEHEYLCVDTDTRFRALATDLGLTWSEASAARVSSSNREGSGYQTRRVASTLPERWREQFDADAIAQARDEWARFPFDIFPGTVV